MDWYFIVSSEEYGREIFGPYDSEQDAKDGIARVQGFADQNRDGVHRLYSAPTTEKPEDIIR